MLPHLGLGGAQRVAASMAAYWVDRGHDVTVVTLLDRPPDFCRLHPRVERIMLPQPNGFWCVPAGSWCVDSSVMTRPLTARRRDAQNDLRARVGDWTACGQSISSCCGCGPQHSHSSLEDGYWDDQLMCTRCSSGAATGRGVVA